MKTKFLFLISLFASAVVAQKLPREVLQGQLVTEGMSVDNILVTNKTANLATTSRVDGTFQIPVRIKDTLVFSGLNFPAQSLILREADLKFKVLNIRIESQVNSLEEVVINPNALTGDLIKDSKNIKINTLQASVNTRVASETLFEADAQTSPDNKLMPGYLDDTYMVDFAKIGRKLLRSFKKSEAERIKNRDISRFSVVVQNRFSDDFFRNTLKMDTNETIVFLTFCENDANAQAVLLKGDDFEIIAFLKQKKQEFMSIKKE